MAQVRQDKIQVQLEVNGQKQVGTTIAELQTQYKQLNRELRNLTIGSEAYIRKQEELRKVQQTLNDQRRAISGVSAGIADAAAESVNFKGKLQDIAKQLILTFGPLAILGQVIGAIISLTQEVFGAAAAFTELNGRVNQLTGLTGEALRTASSDAKAIADTFGVEVNDAIAAANATAQAFAEQGEELGPIFQNNLGLIGERLALLGDKGPEFLDILKEYSVQAVSAGIGIEQFYNLAAEGINRGIPTDKLIDSVKEFDISIKTLTKGQAETLSNVLGKAYSEDLVQAVESGSKTSFEALQEVSTRLNALGPESADAKKLLSDLFGGAGEDAVLFAQVIADTGAEFEDLTGAASQYTKRQLELLAANQANTRAQNELNFALGGTDTFFQKVGLSIRTGFTAALAKVVEIIRYFPDYMGAAGNAILQFLNLGISGFETLLRNMTPVVAIFEAITGRTFELPKFEVQENAFEAVQAKIQADREAFAKEESARLAAQKKKEAQDRAAAEAAAVRPQLEAAKKAEQQKQRTVIEIQRIGLDQQQEQALVAQDALQKQELALRQQYLAERAAAERAAAEARALAEEDLERRKGEKLKEQAVALYNALNALIAARIQRQYDDQIERLETSQQIQMELAGENAQKRAQIEARFAKQKEEAEKQLRRRQQQQALTQVLIDSAASIVKTGAQLGYPAAIPFQVLAGLIGSIQAGVIASQKLEDGGILPELQPRRGRGGMPRGPRHRHGGIRLMAGGRQVGEIEGGEPILSRRTYQNNRPLVDALLYSSMYEGGRRIYEQGGILAAPDTSPSQQVIQEAAQFSDANIVNELRAVRSSILSMELRIGEREAAAIGDMDRKYQKRKNGTRL